MGRPAYPSRERLSAPAPPMAKDDGLLSRQPGLAFAGVGAMLVGGFQSRTKLVV